MSDSVQSQRRDGQGNFEADEDEEDFGWLPLPGNDGEEGAKRHDSCVRCYRCEEKVVVVMAASKAEAEKSVKKLTPSAFEEQGGLRTTQISFSQSTTVVAFLDG